MNNIKVRINNISIDVVKEIEGYKITWNENDKKNKSTIITDNNDLDVFMESLKKYGNKDNKYLNITDNSIEGVIDNIDISYAFDKYISDEEVGDFIICLFSELPFKLHKYTLSLALESEYKDSIEQYI